jgi:hypothetical protein
MHRVPSRSPYAWPLALALAAAVCATRASGDTLELKDGRTIDGEITERDDAYEVKTKYGTLSVPKVQVLRIVPPEGTDTKKPAAPDLLAPPIAPPAAAGAKAAPPAPPPPVAGARAPEPKRLPVPESAAVKEATTSVREIFRAEYAKRSLDALATLAGKLHHAGVTEKDPTLRYVCFSESRDAAARGGDVAAAWRAIDALAKQFDVDAPAMQSAAIALLGRSVRTPETGRALAAAALATAGALAERDEFDPALKALVTAGSAARAAKEAGLVEQVRTDEKAYRALRAEYRKAAPAFRKLETDPDDPAANGTVGTYLCFTKGRWEAGLPHLAKGDDATLKALAAGELAPPADAAARLALADGWHEALAKRSGSAREAAATRALLHYRIARPGLSGEDARRVASRVKELEKIAKIPPVPPGAVLHLSFDRATASTQGGKRILRDLSGSGLHAVLHGGSLVAGVLGEALRLDGGYAVVPAGKALDLGGRGVTIASWVRFDRSFGSEAMLFEHAVFGQAPSWQLTFMNSRKPRVNFPALHAKEKPVDGSFDFKPGTWHHVAGTYDGKTGRIFVDGRRIFEKPVTLPLPAGEAPSYIGSRAGRGLFLRGALDELLVYPRALRAGEVRALYEAGRAGAAAR